MPRRRYPIALGLSLILLVQATPAAAAPLTTSVTVGRFITSFSADRAFGFDLDGHQLGATNTFGQTYTAENVRAIKSVGFQPLAYRLRTELGVDAWNWATRGTWSNPLTHDGYWTGSPLDAGADSNGYVLPRRGDTIDQANSDNYSRLTDGDLSTFWKSNPYLDRRYAGEDIPDWAILDLGQLRMIDTLRIWWGRPYARRFSLQLWSGGGNAIPINGDLLGAWQPAAQLTSTGGSQTIRFASRPVRYLRLLLLSSSHTGPRRDPRDRLGYSIRELAAGMTQRGVFIDLTRHRPDQRQSFTYVSSTDPWHAASGRDPGIAQPGFNRMLSFAHTRAPVVIPVSLLYGTPADAVAEVGWWLRHRVRMSVELGEEPDGQLVDPEAYASLYLQFARALRHRYPRLSLGGPSLATSIPTWETWPDAHGQASWIQRFLARLRAHRASRLLQFFSFEWYPFDDTCATPTSQLPNNQALLLAQLANLRADGVRVPIYVTEYGYSAYLGQPEVDMAGALLNADSVGTLLAQGVSRTYLYGAEPDAVYEQRTKLCDTWGNLVWWLADSQKRIRQPSSAYWESWLLTHRWTLPGRRLERLYQASSSVPGLHVYPLYRPDRRWSTLLVNIGTRDLNVSLARDGRPLCAHAATIHRYDDRSYRWHAQGANGYAQPDQAPRTSRSRGSFSMRPESLAVAVC